MDKNEVVVTIERERDRDRKGHNRIVSGDIVVEKGEFKIRSHPVPSKNGRSDSE